MYLVRFFFLRKFNAVLASFVDRPPMFLFIPSPWVKLLKECHFISKNRETVP